MAPHEFVARKDTGDDGWVDVWKRQHFRWGRNEGKRADLDAAFGQPPTVVLFALENSRGG